MFPSISYPSVFDGTDGSGPSRGYSYIGGNQGIEIINPLALINNTHNETKYLLNLILTNEVFF